MGDKSVSTIGTNAEDLILNADGSGSDIKFKSNGVEKASISDAGAFTSTTIDATKLTGALPAISGAALTGVGVAGITSSADATAITIDSAEKVGIGKVPETWDANWNALEVGQRTTVASYTGGGGATLFSHNAYSGFTSKYQETAGATGIYMDDTDMKFRTAASGSADANITWTDQLNIKADGRGLSQFTAKVWASWEIDGGSPSLYDSHNVSSVVDNGTGDSTINFSNNMANTNYAVAGMSDDTFRGLSLRDYTYTNVAYTRFASWISSNTTYDDAHKLMAIWFGD